MSTQDLVNQQTNTATVRPRPSITYLSLILILAAALIAYLIGDRIGYKRGFSVAYTAEHSHYMFEKRRADTFQKRITSQHRCISKMAASIPPVESGGLAGLGELMQRFGLIYWGTVRCNQTSGFGYVNQQQMNRIMRSSSE